MRVAYLNAYGNGSTGHIIDSLQTLCRKQSIETLFIYGREKYTGANRAIKCQNKITFYLDVLCTRLFDNHGLNSISNTRKIVKELTQFNPDIIHIHNLHGYWINYKILFDYIKNNHIKVIWTLHDCWAFTGHCTHFYYLGCDKWMTGCNHCTQLKEYPASALYDGTKRNYSLKKRIFLSAKDTIIVTPSEWLRSCVKRSFFKDLDIKVINNGVDLNVFRPSAQNRESFFDSQKYSHMILGVAGTWTERKGLQYIVECADQKKEWFFVIIGDRPKNKELDCNLSNVLFLKRTESQKKLAEMYSIADVFVNPSLEDTYSTTIIESMACGTPVVTFATGGNVELIQKTKYGVITEENNTEQLILAIEKCLEIKKGILDDNYRNEMDANHTFWEYIKLYMKMCTN